MAAPRYWTADMVRALPDDGKRYETVYGELLVCPSPGVTQALCALHYQREHPVRPPAGRVRSAGASLAPACGSVRA